MAQKRKHDDDDGESMEGYLHNLTPQQSSVNGNIYYKFSIQTTPDKKERCIGYGAHNYDSLSKFYESKSPIKIRRLNGTTDDGKHIFNEQSGVEAINNLEFKIMASGQTSIDNGNRSQSKFIDIPSLKLCEPFQMNFFTIKGYVTYSDTELKWVKTKFGFAHVQEDAKITDENDSIDFHVWETTFELLESGEAYEITHLTLKKILANYMCLQQDFRA